MKNCWLNLWFLCISCLPFCEAWGQTVNGRGGVLQDFVSPVHADTFRTLVKDDLNTLDIADWGLVQVCLNIHHNRSSDLKVSLVTPAGTSIWLTNRNGGENGSHYSGTCFSPNGFFGYIHQGKNPFNGDYLPDGRFEVLNEDPKKLVGEWLLIVQDLRAGVKGSLGSWSLNFGTISKPREQRCNSDRPGDCLVARGEEEGILLPDLVMLQAFTRAQFIEYPSNHPVFPRQIKFAATIANIGYGPMETRGSNEWYCGDQRVPDGSKPCPDGDSPRQNVLQRIYAKQAGQIIYRDTLAGTNYFDSKPGHQHFHVDNWVEYELIRTDICGRETVVCEGEKVSYCLFDSGACQVDDDLCQVENVNFGPQNLPNYGFGRYTSCSDGIQGISVGGYDTYGSMYEGQNLTLPEGTPNGSYLLRITVDPHDLYLESDEKNNQINIPVHLTKQ